VVLYDKAGYARCETVRKCLLTGPPHVGCSRAFPGFFEGGALQAGHHLSTKRFGHTQFISGSLPIGDLVSKEIFKRMYGSR